MILVLGEVLIDRFPDYQRIGGAPLNFAFHLHHLDQPLRLVTRVGDDPSGRRIEKQLAAHGLSTADVQTDKRHPTGRVDVSLDAEGVPAFDIVAPAAYDFIDLQSLREEGLPAQARLIYFGSLVQRSDHGLAQVRRLLEARSPNTRCFCDINLRPPHYDHQRIENCLRHADILKLNDEELATIGGMLNTGPSMSEAAAGLMDAFQIDTLAVTCGARGSSVFQGGQRFEAPPPPAVSVRDTVGAGDAFAAVLASGVLEHRPMPLILAAATDFAARICEQAGAMPADTEIYKAVKQQLGISPP